MMAPWRRASTTKAVLFSPRVTCSSTHVADVRLFLNLLTTLMFPGTSRGEVGIWMITR